MVMLVDLPAIGLVTTRWPRVSKMRTMPLCALVKVIVMPFTARLNVFSGLLQTKSVFFEELLFAFDDDDFFAEDEEAFVEDEDLAEEEVFASFDELDLATELDDSTIDELEAATELLDATELLETSELEEMLLDDSIGVEAMYFAVNSVIFSRFTVSPACPINCSLWNQPMNMRFVLKGASGKIMSIVSPERT